MNGIPWTEAKIDVLTKEWSAGRESPHIARLLGVSASAVRAKRMRLGLPERSAASQAADHFVLGAALAGKSFRRRLTG